MIFGLYLSLMMIIIIGLMKCVTIQTDQVHFKFKVCLALFLALYPETQMRDWSGPLPHKEYIQTINCSFYSHQTRVLFPTNVKGENNLADVERRKKGCRPEESPKKRFLLVSKEDFGWSHVLNQLRWEFAWNYVYNEFHWEFGQLEWESTVLDWPMPKHQNWRIFGKIPNGI